MKIRTGHGPDDWSDNQPANGSHRSNVGFSALGGELVSSSTESEYDKNRRQKRESIARRRAQGKR